MTAKCPKKSSNSNQKCFSYDIARFGIVRYTCIIWQIKDAFICVNGRKSAKLINTRIRSNCSNESNGLGDQNVVHLYMGRLWMLPQNQQEEKGNSRKRSNKKKAFIKKIVNIFAENEIVNFTLHSFTISKQR